MSVSSRGRSVFRAILLPIGYWVLAGVFVVDMPRRAIVAAVPKASGPDPLSRFEARVAQVLVDLDPAGVSALPREAAVVDRWFDTLAAYQGLAGPDAFMGRVERLVALSARAGGLVDRALAERGRFAALTPGPARRRAVRNYLSVTSTLIDLSGRLRYRLYDAIDDIALAVASAPPRTDQLIRVLRAGRSAIGAVVMADALFDPAPAAAEDVKPLSVQSKEQLLALIAATRPPTLEPVLARLAGMRATPPALVIGAAEAIRRTGLPQTPRPGRAANLPRPPITAHRLYRILVDLRADHLPKSLARRRARLLDWLRPQLTTGLPGNRYQLGSFEVQAGDWLLMRNPSPYNRFTDLSPGLFTHVGVITVETGSDGIRRMVVVDLPERGRRMRATTVDTFVQRTLHYLVLRHPDPEVARRMAARAREAIGVRTEFDLNFRTRRVAALRGKPLAGRKIHTYCAGLLLLCAQETGRDRREFFPLTECPAGGNTVGNLARLGMTFGREFVSPTGALFSPRLRLVGRRQPMYEPRREIQEGIYDHFARRLIDGVLRPAPNLVQSLRLKLAKEARGNPVLARAMADVAGVDRDTDLVSAAKTLAVVETLDQIARRNSDEFFLAHAAIMADLESAPAKAAYTSQQIKTLRVYRQRHAELLRAWQAGDLSARQLRLRLVAYYLKQGREQLDARFFRAE